MAVIQAGDRSPKSWGKSLLLSVFLGPFGIHEFYLGNKVFGVLKLITLNLLLIGWIIDVANILCMKKKDINGLTVRAQKGHNMSLISILDKIESKQLELEEKKEEINQQIRDLNGLEFSLEDKINEVAEDIAETRRNMIMEGVADIEGLLMEAGFSEDCLLYTSPSPRDRQKSRMPSSA